MRVAVYPGSFDPITNGHLDIIKRACQLFDTLIVAIAENPQKKALFSLEERLEMLHEVLKDLPKVRIDAYRGLTVEYARRQGACAIIRGLRAISDFENEFVMALTNKKLAPEIETLFLMTEAKYSFISSSAVKEVAYYGGCLKDMVPPPVEARLRAKFREIKRLGEE
ncbi:pantetheine-phosphate adenylyltransferase [Ammonifex degensii KC4]|uniref:Phosphopantetheine adenylyltransferase n=1 Tax=Ammonifex degensii (strain DSM 10501 / KC4) TaxID=429009 RepID=C9RAL3_AMMDK|nr:pantetheine-phosphate adenylyltransferase [Ammonifex degensii]ACX51290.1 pantetheine-phosphate adenylyltransferase [Ammonifex degensii KC4]